MTTSRKRSHLWSVILCAIAGFVIFQFWGNATHGYISTNSLFYWWGFQWTNPESETEHAWLILGLSVFLCWRNLKTEPQEAGSQDRAAAVALVGALMLHSIGFIAQQPRLSIIGLLLMVWGLLALAGGRRWGSASAFPAAFMVFAIPVNALDTAGFWLRMWVVQSGAWIAHLFGIGVIRNGTQLIAPDGRYQYDVVAACSGVRSLVALSALALFIGYLWFRPVWLRAAILFLSFPLVYLGNVIRISSIIIAAQWGGQAWGDRVHNVMGIGVFIIVLGGVITFAEVVSHLKPAWRVKDGVRNEPVPASEGPSSSGAAIAVLVILAAAADGVFLSYRSSLPPAEIPGVILTEDGRSPVVLPTFLASDWMGRNIEPTAVERAILPPDTGYSRKLYMSREGPNEQVLLSIVLSGRDRSSIHRPELCLVGQGWTIDSTSFHRFRYPGRADADFSATLLHVRRDLSGVSGRTSVPELVIYWFVGGDRIVASQGARMIFDGWNRILHGRADRWAYVLLQTGAADGDVAALARIQSVLNGSLPSFQPPIPENER